MRHLLDSAKSLLAGTDLPMPALAERAGFSNARHLSVVFRQETGLTPTAYRHQFRSGRGDRRGHDPPVLSACRTEAGKTT